MAMLLLFVSVGIPEGEGQTWCLKFGLPAGGGVWEGYQGPVLVSGVAGSHWV